MRADLAQIGRRFADTGFCGHQSRIQGFNSPAAPRRTAKLSSGVSLTSIGWGSRGDATCTRNAMFNGSGF
jgi:hypothetical protein